MDELQYYKILQFPSASQQTSITLMALSGLCFLKLPPSATANIIHYTHAFTGYVTLLTENKLCYLSNSGNMEQCVVERDSVLFVSHALLVHKDLKKTKRN